MLVFFYVVHDVIDVEVLENSRTAAAVNILPSAVYNEASATAVSVVPELSLLEIFLAKQFSFNNQLSFLFAQHNARVLRALFGYSLCSLISLLAVLVCLMFLFLALASNYCSVSRAVSSFLALLCGLEPVSYVPSSLLALICLSILLTVYSA